MKRNTYKVFASRLWNSLDKVAPQVWIVVIALLAYYQIAFLQNSLKWDMIIGYLPRRYFIGECLQNGIFPLWNPFGQAGYPLYANLISVWSPEILLPAFISGYTNLTLHLFFMLHIILAGTGMYHLQLYLVKNRRAALLIGIAYMLSGFFIGNAQHANFLTGGAWLPFVLLFYFKLFDAPSKVSFAALLVVLFLMVTGGYPALSIILAYVLAALFIYLVTGLLMRQKYRQAFQWTGINLGVAAIIGLLSLGQIYALQEVTPYINRFAELSPDKILTNSFTLRAMLSLLFPYATVSNGDFWGTDISMANGYLGLFMLLFFLAGIFNTKNQRARFFMATGLVSLLAALGEALPVRMWMYHSLPFMDKFQYPAVFRIFFILFFLLAAGYALRDFEKRHISYRAVKRVALGLLILVVAGIVYSAWQLKDAALTFQQMKESVFGRIVIQGSIQLLLLLLFMIGLHISKMKKGLWLTLLVIADMLLSVQFNIHSTAVSDKDPIQFYRQIKAQPAGFPIPELKSINRHTNKTMRLGLAWKNGSIFRKEVSFDTYNPFQFRQYKTLADSLPGLRDSVLKNPVVYLSDTVAPFRILEDRAASRNLLTVTQDVYDTLKYKNLSKASTDSLQILEFRPGYIKVKTTTKDSTLLTLLQTAYKGWNVHIDGKKQPYVRSNKLFMSTLLPEGAHTVEFRFKKPTVLIFLGIAYSIFILLSAALFITVFRKQKRWTKAAMLIAAGLLFLFIADGLTQQPYEALQKRNYEKIKARLERWKTQYALERLPVAGSVDHPHKFREINPFPDEQIYLDRYYIKADVPGFIQTINELQNGYIIYLHSNVYMRPEIEGLVRRNYPGLVETLQLKHAQLQLRKKGKHDIAQTLHGMENFESYAGKHAAGIDSTKRFSGNQSLRLKPDVHYGPALRINISEKFVQKPIKVLGTVYFLMPQKERAFLVLKYFRGEQFLEDQYLPLETFRRKANGWNQAALGNVFPPPETTVINAFVWKPGDKTAIWIDNMQLMVYQ